MMDRLDRIEKRLDEIERRMSLGQEQEGWPWPSGVMPVCGCKVGTVCMNVACPHRFEVTCVSIPIEGSVK